MELEFFGREAELAELNRRWESNRFEMGVIYGARRIGKSSLINSFFKGRNAFRFQARRGSEDDNLRAFSREFNLFRGIRSQLRYDSFEALFDDIAEYAKDGRFALAIDELAYLCVRSKNLLSTLQFYIDGKFREANMILLLSGSNITFMEELLNNRNDPLYQRATFEMNIRKLPFSESKMFLTKIPKEERGLYLALFGGFPFYLSMIDPGCSFSDNLRNLLFHPFGALIDAPDKVLPIGMSEQNTYTSILRAVALGKSTSKEIADYVGDAPNYLAKYLNNLVETQVLDRKEAFTRNRKMNYYEVSDNLLKFWYRFLYDDLDNITLGAGDAVFEEKKEDIRLFLSHGMEDVAIAYMTEKNVKGELPTHYGVIRNYRVEHSQLGRSIELDGLAESIEKKDQSLLVIECKYRNSPFTSSMLRRLEESVSVFPGYSRIDYYLFSKSGFSEEMESLQRDDVHLTSFDDILV